MIGKTLKELGIEKEVIPSYFSVKEAVFPFSRFPGVDPVLGPEMKSTGEVMGIDPDLGLAYMKAQIAAGQKLPMEGKIFISVDDRQYSNFEKFVNIIDGKNIKVVKESKLRKNTSEYQINLVLDTWLNMQRIKDN